MAKHFLLTCYHKFVAGFIVVVFTAACSPRGPISSADISVKYAVSPTINATEASQGIDVFITNTSQGCVQFPDDFGLKIYYRDGGSWKETRNLMQYAPAQNNHLGPHGEPFETTSVSLLPDLSHIEIRGSLPMKATIKGHICNDPSAFIEKDIPFTIIP